jgi:Rieske Fe-S protein
MPAETASEVSRRSLLRGAAVGGVALPLLVACGNDGGGAAAAGGGAGGTLTKTSDVPVGGGTILPDQQVVVTQPAKGEFKAFSAVCTHMSCLVNSVSDGEIHCPCHGSVYSIKDGSVLGGPAPQPLPPVKISVEGAEIVKG